MSTKICQVCLQGKLNYSDSCFQCGYSFVENDSDLYVEIFRRVVVSRASKIDQQNYWRNLDVDSINKLLCVVKSTKLSSSPTSWKYSFSKKVPISTNLSSGYAFHLTPTSGRPMFISASHICSSAEDNEYPAWMGDDEDRIPVTLKVHLNLHLWDTVFFFVELHKDDELKFKELINSSKNVTSINVEFQSSKGYVYQFCKKDKSRFEKGDSGSLLKHDHKYYMLFAREGKTGYAVDTDALLNIGYLGIERKDSPLDVENLLKQGGDLCKRTIENYPVFALFQLLIESLPICEQKIEFISKSFVDEAKKKISEVSGLVNPAITAAFYLANQAEKTEVVVENITKEIFGDKLIQIRKDISEFDKEFIFSQLEDWWGKSVDILNSGSSKPLLFYVYFFAEEI